METILVGMCGSLADATRLRALRLLEEHEELHVTAIAEFLGQTQTSASRHLAHLERHAWVRAERRAQRVYYRLSDDCVSEVLDTLRRCAGRVAGGVIV